MGSNVDSTSMHCQFQSTIRRLPISLEGPRGGQNRIIRIRYHHLSERIILLTGNSKLTTVGRILLDSFQSVAFSVASDNLNLKSYYETTLGNQIPPTLIDFGDYENQNGVVDEQIPVDDLATFSWLASALDEGFDV